MRLWNASLHRETSFFVGSHLGTKCKPSYCLCFYNTKPSLHHTNYPGHYPYINLTWRKTSLYYSCLVCYSCMPAAWPLFPHALCSGFHKANMAASARWGSYLGAWVGKSGWASKLLAEYTFLCDFTGPTWIIVVSWRRPSSAPVGSLVSVQPCLSRPWHLSLHSPLTSCLMGWLHQLQPVAPLLQIFWGLMNPGVVCLWKSRPSLWTQNLVRYLGNVCWANRY